MADSQFQYVIYIRTTQAELWKALTEPELTRQYWAETRQECDWQPGSPWRLMIPDGRVADAGKIVDIEPENRLTIQWRNEFIPEMREEGYSTLTYNLETQGESVKFTVAHQMDRPNSQLIESVSEGWPHILSSLKSMLETGESLLETRKWPEGI